MKMFISNTSRAVNSERTGIREQPLFLFWHILSGKLAVHSLTSQRESELISLVHQPPLNPTDLKQRLGVPELRTWFDTTAQIMQEAAVSSSNTIDYVPLNVDKTAYEGESPAFSPLAEVIIRPKLPVPQNPLQSAYAFLISYGMHIVRLQADRILGAHEQAGFRHQLTEFVRQTKSVLWYAQESLKTLSDDFQIPFEVRYTIDGIDILKPEKIDHPFFIGLSLRQQLLSFMLYLKYQLTAYNDAIIAHDYFGKSTALNGDGRSAATDAVPAELRTPSFFGMLTKSVIPTGDSGSSGPTAPTPLEGKAESWAGQLIPSPGYLCLELLESPLPPQAELRPYFLWDVHKGESAPCFAAGCSHQYMELNDSLQQFSAEFGYKNKRITWYKQFLEENRIAYLEETQKTGSIKECDHRRAVSLYEIKYLKYQQAQQHERPLQQQ